MIHTMIKIVLWVVMIAVLAAAVAGIIAIRSMDKDKKEGADSVSMVIVDPEGKSGEQELTDADRTEGNAETRMPEPEEVVDSGYYGAIHGAVLRSVQPLQVFPCFSVLRLVQIQP